MGDLLDGADLSLLGQDPSTAAPTYNLGGYLANMGANASYSMNMLMGTPFDQAGAAGASYGNALSAQNGTLPGQSSSGNALSAQNGTLPGQSSSGNAMLSSNAITRIVAVVVGVVLVIGALYLFGSSSISDSIGNAVSAMKQGGT